MYYNILYNMYNIEDKYQLLNDTDNKIKQPEDIKIMLKEHQKTIVCKMANIEETRQIIFTDKKDINRNNYEPNIAGMEDIQDIKNSYLVETCMGILGDSVGSGKSYVVVTLINNYKNNNNLLKYTHFVGSSCKYVNLKKTITAQTFGQNLLIVPHNLILQWIEYFKVSNLKIKKFNKHTDFENIEISDYDVVLVSANKYDDFRKKYNITNWFRIFVDEIDSIKLKQNVFDDLKANFTWFITGTPCYYTFREKRFLRNTFRIMNSTIFNAIVIKNEQKYIDQSMQLPVPNIFRIECYTPKHLQIVSNYVSGPVLEMINAGDMKSAIEKMNCNVDTETNIIQLVTQKIRNEKHNLEVKLQGLSQMIVVNKEEHDKKIKKITDKIEQQNIRLQSIEEKIKNMNTELCPICLDDFNKPTIIDCCKSIFCFECITMSYNNKKECPLCRAHINNDNFNIIDNKNEFKKNKKEIKTCGKKSKIKELFNILKKNKNGKYLLFSNHYESFNKIMVKLQKKNITYSILSGSNDRIKNIINNFENGTISVLMLNAQHYGSGLNLQMATDVIMYHKFSKELEEQVIGRAQRLGRQTSLNIHYLLYDNEMAGDIHYNSNLYMNLDSDSD
jgi:hypothetical protein